MEFTIDALRTTDVPVDLGSSGWTTIDQARIDAFADATEDRQWIHTDPERAAATPFGGTIAHGFLLLAMVPKLFTELFAVPEAEMLVNYGIDKVRFLQPVASGSALRLRARIVSVTPKGERFLLRIRGDLESRPLTAVDAPPRRSVVVETLFLVVPPNA